MAAFGTNFNPTAVAMGRNSGGPYLWSGPGSRPPSVGPVSAGQQTGQGQNVAPSVGPISTPRQQNVLSPESIRAIGAGPFDAAYRQNLATYAGGQFSRPGGLSFNPTDPSTFPGQPTGGGTAPVTGMPNSLMDMALAGQGFSWTPPQPAKTATQPPDFASLQQWMDQFMRNGRGQRMGSIL